MAAFDGEKDGEKSTRLPLTCPLTWACEGRNFKDSMCLHKMQAHRQLLPVGARRNFRFLAWLLRCHVLMGCFALRQKRAVCYGLCYEG
jgi:hypothetical protein